MSELRRTGADTPAERADPPPAPDRPEAAAVDYRAAIPAQKEFIRETADRAPEAESDVPYAIDWSTGAPADAVPDKVGRVDDPMAETRPYDRDGGLTEPDPRDQWSLDHSVPRDADGQPEKYPSPKGEWFTYINDGGPEADPLRGNNCLDCSLAAMATYHGYPTVAAPRSPDDGLDGAIDTASGEVNGPARAEEWLECRYRGMGASDDGLARIEQQLLDGGPGSSAAIVHSWSAELLGGAHAWNAFNDNGTIVWCDPQLASVDERPMYRGSDVNKVWAICIDRDGNQL
jgi:hypothetical protein